ncbi:MAG: hypothetical protein QGF90_12275, partial [Gammaproteobacteria bacterium]|nr:hypothetical protein [Gammaproteobacteria bacterium]
EDRKNGVDDYLASGKTVDDLRLLVSVPRPEPQPAAPRLELLMDEPDVMRRPLALIDGKAYAATWLTVKVTRSESLNSRGQVVKHVPPKTVNERRLFVIRDDGVIFGEGDTSVTPIADIGFTIKLPERLHTAHRWSAHGVQVYSKGTRPNPAEVFHDVAAAMDNFIDFDQSLADQLTMCKMLACYVISTWMLDGLQVMGYLWPNGDRGSGKTHLLHVVSQLAYLGQLILAGGSYATLRDLADYGATLCFDDAETLASRGDGDSDKRSLLLAGNRRGAVVTVKELGPDKVWETRYVNAFCPRLFSATQLPDEILASRTIVVPLIRTLDRRRANIDPADPEAWPVSADKLRDALWALGLMGLPRIAEHDRGTAKLAGLQGRSLQPW